MNKKCTNCSTPFEITDEDQKFYARLNVPAPTHCPMCRLVRRMTWRNDRTFYKRKCDFSGKDIISIFPADAPFPVYHPDVWWSDKWDPMEYGQDFDFDRPFFEQFQELMNKVPRMSLDLVNCENSYFCNYSGDMKNCYLDIAGEGNEDCYYNLFTKYSTNCTDCTFAYNCELCYECIYAYKSYNCKFCIYIENSTECLFSFDLKGCNNCIFSNNLRQKEYCILNKQYSKEEYFKKLEEIQTGSYENLQRYIDQWLENIGKAVHRDMYNLNSENSTGNNIQNSKNCHFSFNVKDCEDSKFLYDVLEAKDCYDMNYSLYKPEVAYETISTLQMKFSAFNLASHYCNNQFYSQACDNSSDLFGCVGLKRKQYCILNKQYSKEDYENLRGKIVEHMKKTGEWGEFFPISLSPHAYNETVAQEYYPLSKEQALERGYKWKDKDQKNYLEQSKETPDDIKDVQDSIVNEILACNDCGKNFRVIEEEVKFYRKQNLAIPRKCPDCRHMNRINLRNRRWLWESKCTKCNVEISTSYNPENSPTNIYCEKCYLETIY